MWSTSNQMAQAKPEARERSMFYYNCFEGQPISKEVTDLKFEMLSASQLILKQTKFNENEFDRWLNLARYSINPSWSVEDLERIKVYLKSLTFDITKGHQVRDTFYDLVSYFQSMVRGKRMEDQNTKAHESKKPVFDAGRDAYSNEFHQQCKRAFGNTSQPAPEPAEVC